MGRRDRKRRVTRRAKRPTANAVCANTVRHLAAPGRSGAGPWRPSGRAGLCMRASRAPSVLIHARDRLRRADAQVAHRPLHHLVLHLPGAAGCAVLHPVVLNATRCTGLQSVVLGCISHRLPHHLALHLPDAAGCDAAGCTAGGGVGQSKDRCFPSLELAALRATFALYDPTLLRPPHPYVCVAASVLSRSSARP
jgi:hypothetical protein